MKNEYGEVLDRNGYAPSIVGEQNRCFQCGRSDIKLDRHEVWHGSNRTKCKNLGLWVNLCMNCHRRLHQKGDGLDSELKQKMQVIAMDYYGWGVDEFRKVIGKSYI